MALAVKRTISEDSVPTAILSLLRRRHSHI
jgi:hypothetical protein